MGVISAELGQLALILAAVLNMVNIGAGGFWGWGFAVGIWWGRKCRPSTETSPEASACARFACADLAEDISYPTDGKKNFLKLLTVRFYCLMQVPWETGTVRRLSTRAVLEPFCSSDQRCPGLFSMHRDVQRALLLSMFCTP